MEKNVSIFPCIVRKHGNITVSTGNNQGNIMETRSLKALADKVLQGNSDGNKMETRQFPYGNIDGNMDIIKAEYSAFSLWLSERDMVDKRTPAYQDVLTQIRAMDRAMVKGDVTGFKTAVRDAKYCFIEAEQNGKRWK